MDADAKFSPPYNIPWATFLSTVERIAADPPGRVDRSYLDSQSGTVQTYLISALKAFGLIDGDAHPIRVLEFADADTRKREMADLIREFYPTIVPFGEQNTTPGQLIEAFSEAFPNITGESRIKAIRFFTSAMTYAELPIAPLWGTVKAPRGASGKKSTPRKPKNIVGNGEGATTPPTPPAVPMSDEDMKRMYFQLLLKKADRDDSDDSMLDRIERLVGIQSGTDKTQDRGRKPAGSTPATPADSGSQAEG